MSVPSATTLQPLVSIWAHIGRGTNALLAALLAPACVACGRILDAPAGGPTCPACWARLRPLSPPLCGRCGHPLPTASAFAEDVNGIEPRACTVCAAWPAGRISKMRALGPYNGVLQELVHALKYGGRRSLAERLGGLLRLAAADVLAGSDAVVPVPMHPARRWQRGFNQADLLARALGPPVWPVLRRARATAPQAGLSATARHRNVAGAFRPRRLALLRGLAAGRTLVLVDDVSTTGETLLACAAVLREAGAREVRAAVVARTVLEHAPATSAALSPAQVAR